MTKLWLAGQRALTSTHIWTKSPNDMMDKCNELFDSIVHGVVVSVSSCRLRLLFAKAQCAIGLYVTDLMFLISFLEALLLCRLRFAQIDYTLKPLIHL